MTYKLNLAGIETKYSFVEKASVIRNETRGGLPYYRNDLDDTSISLQISFILSKAQYDEFWIFYRVGSNYGALPFLMDLVIDNGNSSEYTCYFGNPQLTQVNSGFFTVEDTLEVLPASVDATFDKAICMIYELSGGYSDRYLNLFNQIVNVNWPVA